MSMLKAAACLKYLRRYELANCMPPTVRDVMVAMGLKSTSQATRLLNDLEARGYIKIKPRKIRGIQIIDRMCPHCGHDLNSPAGSKTVGEAPGDALSPPAQPVAGGTF